MNVGKTLRRVIGLVVMGIALVGSGIAGYLSAYQLGLVQSVWDPIFAAASSVTIVTSSYSPQQCFSRPQR